MCDVVDGNTVLISIEMRHHVNLDVGRDRAMSAIDRWGRRGGDSELLLRFNDKKTSMFRTHSSNGIRKKKTNLFRWMKQIEKSPIKYEHN